MTGVAWGVLHGRVGWWPGRRLTGAVTPSISPSQGDYPAVMRKVLGSQLPKFTPAQKAALKGSMDFFGLNYYTSHYVRGEGPHNVRSSASVPAARRTRLWEHRNHGWQGRMAGTLDALA